ncbi:MAG: class I SAM-dependent DNA methyltransferase, partial [Planctomycetota bacterium]
MTPQFRFGDWTDRTRPDRLRDVNTRWRSESTPFPAAFDEEPIMPDNESVRHFDEAAAGWDEKPERVALARSVADAIAEHVPLPPTTRALEYGCGTGLVGLALAPRLGRLTAADSSEGMLGVLREKLQRGAADNVDPVRLDLQTDPPPAGPFDLVFSSMTLHHVEALDRVLAAFAGLLAPGGRLAVVDLEAEDGSFHGDRVDVEHHGFAPDALAERIRKAGLVPEGHWTAARPRREVD